MDTKPNMIKEAVANDISAALEDGRAYTPDGRLLRDFGGLVVARAGEPPKLTLHWDLENRMLRALPACSRRAGWILVPVDPEAFEPGDDPDDAALDEMRHLGALIRYRALPVFLDRLGRELEELGFSSGLEN